MSNDKASPLEKEIIISWSSLIFWGSVFCSFFSENGHCGWKLISSYVVRSRPTKFQHPFFSKQLEWRLEKNINQGTNEDTKCCPPTEPGCQNVLGLYWSARLAVSSEWVHCHQRSLDYSLGWEFNRLLPNPSPYSMDSIFRRSLGDLSYREPEYLIQMSLIPTRQVRRIN